jgi:hypothetical protein
MMHIRPRPPQDRLGPGYLILLRPDLQYRLARQPPPGPTRRGLHGW